MSGVVLRCPNCGTVRLAEGECEACHEAQVRHFCTNHSPGLWLNSGVCEQCGARFGDPVPAREVPPALPARSPGRPSSARETRPDLRGSGPEVGPWGVADPPDVGRERPDPARLLLAIFNAAAHARGSRPVSSDEGEYATSPRRKGGCVGKLLMLTLLLLALFLLVPILLGALIGFG